MQEYKLFINGECCSSKSGKTFDCVDPSTGKLFAQVSDAGIEDMQLAISAARDAFEGWAALTIKERGKYLIETAKLIRKNAKELAALESTSTGKTSKQTTFIDVPTVADTFEYFGNIESELKPSINPVEAPVKSITEREPIGVIACIIPWNYPLVMAGWKIAPALIAGNTIVFRPSRYASVSILRLAQIMKDAGLPEGVVNVVASSDHDVSSELSRNKDVDMISFTGGNKTGQELMRLASVTTKKVSLELGGKSPNIVFADCDRDAALGGTMSAIFMNQGQMCTAGSRLILEDKIYDEFLKELVEKTNSLKIGPSDDYSTDFGPIANEKQLKTISDYIQKGKDEGATLLCGGNKLDRDGFYVEPAIFSDVKETMAIAQEEIFGPVLWGMKFSSVEEAIKLANNTQYGLASCVWTKDLNKGSPF